MSTDKKWFGKRDKGGKKAKGAVEELGSNVYVCEVQGANDKFVKTTEAIADYVGRELGKPMCDLVNGFDNPPKEPELPANAKKDSPEARKWDRDYSHYLHQTETYELNKGKVFVIILGQCTLAVKNKLKSLGTDYAQLQQQVDVLGLLQAIRNIALANADIQYEHWGAAQALKKLAAVNQHNDESLPQFYKRWTNARDVAELQWGPLYPTKLVKQTEATDEVVEDSTETEEQSAEAQPKQSKDNSEEIRNRFQACLYLAGVNQSIHGKVIEELSNQYLHKQNNYPDNPEDAMTMLSHRLDTTNRKSKKESIKPPKDEKQEASFNQKEKKKPTRDQDSDEGSQSSTKWNRKGNKRSNKPQRAAWSN